MKRRAVCNLVLAACLLAHLPTLPALLYPARNLPSRGSRTKVGASDPMPTQLGAAAACGMAAALGLGYAMLRSVARHKDTHVPSFKGGRRISFTDLRKTRKSVPALGGTVIFLYSDCLDAEKQFWGADVGLTVVADKGTVVFYQLPCTGGSLAIVQQGVSAASKPPVSARNVESDTVMVCLLSEDVEGWTRRLSDRGHPVVQTPQDNERFGIRNALLRSPSGYLVEIQCFTNPAEHRRFTV